MLWQEVPSTFWFIDESKKQLRETKLKQPSYMLPSSRKHCITYPLEFKCPGSSKRKKGSQLLGAPLTLGIFPTPVLCTDLLIFLIHMVSFSYRKADMGKKHSQFPSSSYRRIFSLHTSRTSSPVFAQGQGSYLSSSAATAFLCSGHCLRMQLWQCPTPLAATPPLEHIPRLLLDPGSLLRQLPSCTGALLKRPREPRQHLICLTAQTDNCASTAEKAKHNRGRNGQLAHRGKAPQLPIRENLNQLLTVL